MWYVFYEDDWCDNGGVGLEKFEELPGALAFIEKRMAAEPGERPLDRYTLIEGHEAPLKPLTVVTKITTEGA